MATIEMRHDCGSLVTIDGDDVWMYGDDFTVVNTEKVKEAKTDGGNSGTNRRDKSSESASGSGRAGTSSKAD